MIARILLLVGIVIACMMAAKTLLMQNNRINTVITVFILII